MIPSTLRLALPLSQPPRYIELSDLKNWGTKGSTEIGAIYRLAHAANTIGANPNDQPGYLISLRPGPFALGPVACGTRKSHPPLPPDFLTFWTAAHPKDVVIAKYIAQLFVRIVIVSQNYRAAFVTVRACVEILNDKQILLSMNMKFGQRVQICLRLLR
jgi:hypothetical protein